MGFLLFALTMSVKRVIYHHAISLAGIELTVQRFIFFDLISIEDIGTILAAIILLPVFFTRLRKPLLPFIYRVFLPLIAAVLILLNSFPTGSLPHTAGLIGIYIFFSIIGLLALASFSAIANAKEFSVPLVFGLAIAAFSIVSFLGIQLGSVTVISDNFNAILIVFATLYFIYLGFSPGLRAWKTMFVPSEPPSIHTLNETMEQRCKQLSDEHGLTKRESEILGFLGRGYNPAFIAKKLFLSDSTVRTHVKRIYRKLDIHSKEELVQLIVPDE